MGTAFSGGYYKGKDSEYQRQQLEIAALNAKARETEQAMAKNVKVIDTDGLDETTISQIEEVMIYTNDYYENDTLFVELHNSKGEIIRIFPERIQEIC